MNLGEEEVTKKEKDTPDSVNSLTPETKWMTRHGGSWALGKPGWRARREGHVSKAPKPD